MMSNFYCLMKIVEDDILKNIVKLIIFGKIENYFGYFVIL